MSIIKKPWGYEELIYPGPEYVMKKLFMRAGHACSLQYHEFKHESVYLVSGELELEIGESLESLKKQILYPGDSRVIAPLLVHRMSALSDAIYLESSTAQLNDVVRLRDNYGRS